MLLDRDGNILQRDSLTIQDLQTDKADEIQVSRHTKTNHFLIQLKYNEKRLFNGEWMGGKKTNKKFVIFLWLFRSEVLWCSDPTPRSSEAHEEPPPLLILAQTNQLLRVAFDRLTSVWKADRNARQPCWIGALAASADGSIYAGLDSSATLVFPC